LHAFIAKLRAGYELVMGNRFRGGIAHNAMPFLNRYLGNPVLSMVGRVFFKSSIGDFHCGLRGFERNTFLKLELQGDGMEFASEMIVKATLNKLSITEVPTKLYPDGRNRKPHLRPWRDGWRHLRLLLLWSPHWLFLYPGLTLMSFGFLLMLILFRGPVVIGHVNFDIHTMLFSSLFMVTGMQAICFAIYADFIATKHLNVPTRFGIHKKVSLEFGLIVGILFLIAGFFGACSSLFIWQQHAFGPLVPSQIMRVLIPSTTCILLGSQLIFASFLFSLINMHCNQARKHECEHKPYQELSSS
jgi:hypothetical protein